MSQAKNLIEFSEFVKLSEQNTGLAKKWKSVYDTLKSITDKVQKSYKAFPSSANIEKDPGKARGIILNMASDLDNASKALKDAVKEMEDLANMLLNP